MPLSSIEAKRGAGLISVRDGMALGFLVLGLFINVRLWWSIGREALRVDRVSLSALRLPAADVYLMVALSTESEPTIGNFEAYLHLLRTFEGRYASGVILVPDPAKLAAMHLDDHAGWATKDALMRQCRLSMVEISSTPAVLLVDEHGNVLKRHSGVLSPKDMQSFRAIGESIRLPHARREFGINANDVSRFLHDHITRIVDTRNRSAFASGHITGAINIPIDELGVRWPFEIPHTQPLLLHCDDEKSLAAEQNCRSAAIFGLQWPVAVYYLSDSAEALSAAGVWATGGPR